MILTIYRTLTQYGYVFGDISAYAILFLSKGLLGVINVILYHLVLHFGLK